MNNSMEMIKNIMSNKNPQQVIQNMISSNTNPMLNNLINMAQRVLKILLEIFLKKKEETSIKNFPSL